MNEKDRLFWYYAAEHDELEVKKRMKEREIKVELESRFEALNPSVRTYLCLTQSLQAPDLPGPARGVLEGRQQEELRRINFNPGLQAELANYLSFRNAQLKPLDKRK